MSARDNIGDANLQAISRATGFGRRTIEALLSLPMDGSPAQPMHGRNLKGFLVHYGLVELKPFGRGALTQKGKAVSAAWRRIR